MFKKISVVLVVIALASFALLSNAATYGKYSDNVYGSGAQRGLPILGAQITVYSSGTTSIATIYTDPAGNYPIDQTNMPLLTDSEGYYEFYSANGFYDIKISIPGFIAKWVTGVQISWVSVPNQGNPLYASQYASLDDAISNITGSSKTLIIDAPVTLLATQTTPATLSIEMRYPGMIVSSGTQTLTINGGFTAPVSYQTFSGFTSGQVTFGPGAVKEVYPQWWGAVARTAGDLGDDTNAIQACINAAAGVSKVIIPTGHYTVSSHIQLSGNSKVGISIPSNTEIVMNDTTYIHASSAGAPFDGSNIFYTYNTNNVTIRGGNLVGDGDTHTDATLDHSIGFRIQGASNVFVYDLKLTKITHHGFSILYDDNNSPFPESENVHLINCSSTYAGQTGVAVVGLIDGSIEGGNYSYNGTLTTQGGIDVEPNVNKGGGGTPSVVKNLTISGITANNNIGTGIEVYGIGTVQFVDIIGNQCNNNSTSGIKIHGSDSNSISNIRVLRNKINLNTQHGIRAFSCENVMIDNNIANGNGMSGIIVQNPYGVTTKYISICNNNCNNNGPSDDPGINIYGSSGKTINDIMLISNMVNSSGGAGIQAQWTVNARISNGNYSLNSQTTDSAHDGIYIINSLNPIIENNTVRHGGGAKQHRYGINLNTCTDATVKNNDLITSGRTLEIYDDSTRSNISANTIANIASYGSFTMPNASDHTVSNGNVLSSSIIIIVPTNSSAATLMGGAKSLKVFDKIPRTSFSVGTADAGSAAGTETFNYIIY